MPSRKIKIEDLRRFVFISDPQISPDGKSIAFVHTKIDYKNDSYIKHIWIWDGSTNKATQFTHGIGNDTYPRWSPDGKQILFLSTGREPNITKNALWVIPRLGGEARMVAETKEGVSRPEWSPDSKQILFLSKVWTAKKPDTDVKIIKRVKFKLNGLGTFEGRRTHLFIVSTGRKAKQISKGEFDVEVAHWSHDGHTIAYLSNKNSDADISRIKDIFVIPSRGGDSKNLTQSTHVITDFSWSASGNQVAFVGHDKLEGLASNYDIWIMPSRGGNKTNLTMNFDRSLNMTVGSDVTVSTPNPGAVWNQDEKSIYFLAASIPHTNLYKVNLENRSVEVVTKGINVDGFSVSHDGSKIAFIAFDSITLAEVWIKKEDKVRKITNFNDRLLKGLDLSYPEHFTFLNGVGDEIDGWIIKPPGHYKNAKYPALLEIHGGPRSVYGDGLFHEFQILATEGYVVFYTNPRGSAGYGEDYAEAVRGHYGECDYEDLMLFTDEVLRKFNFIDPKNLGVLGGSYGGYMTNWIIGHTDRFVSAVTFRSISNWISKFGVSDIGYMQPESISGTKDYWDEMNKHLERSPIKYAKNVKTPCLIIHSENDLRCPMEQAVQWFVSLKLQGVPTELIRFPDETHELSRSGKPKHREERLRHTIRWFNKYLKQDSE
jgi:dipeptidyl aminopeptidase/acylaminoacyl peptidase